MPHLFKFHPFPFLRYRKKISPQQRTRVLILDLDNTLWYGNLQRHGYLFAELIWRFRNHYSLGKSVKMPRKDFLAGWQIYRRTLHMCAPQQLEIFLKMLQKERSLPLLNKKSFSQLYKKCTRWIDRRYWGLIKKPEILEIASKKYERGKSVRLVPDVKAVVKEIRKTKKMDSKFKVVGLSLNLKHVSEAVLSLLGIIDIFDEIYGADWKRKNFSKKAVIKKIIKDFQIKDKKQVLLVGDSARDIINARSIGIRSLAINIGPTSKRKLLAAKPKFFINKWPKTPIRIREILGLPQKKDSYVIGIDVGGTKIRAGLVHPKGELVSKPLVFQTPSFKIFPDESVLQLQKRLTDIIQKIVASIKAKYPDFTIEVGAISFAGLVKQNGIVTKAADIYGNWGSWKSEKGIKTGNECGGKFYLKHILEEKIPDIEWFVFNDVVAASWRYGIKNNYKNLRKLSVITISTGIGYVIFDIKNQVLEDMSVVSLGHRPISNSPLARRCDCGGIGHLTAYSSGRAAERRLRSRAIKEMKKFEQSLLFKKAYKKIIKSSKQTRLEILKDRETVSLLISLDPTLQKKVVQILKNHKISIRFHFFIKNFFNKIGPAEKIALALSLDNKDFLSAVNENDVFSLKLFEDIVKKLALGFKWMIVEEQLDKRHDRIILMGGLAHATRNRFKKLLIRHLKKLINYKEVTLSKMIVWGETDDVDGIIGSVIAANKAKEKKNCVSLITDKFNNHGFCLHSLEKEKCYLIEQENIFKNHKTLIEFYKKFSSKKTLILCDPSIPKSLHYKITQYFEHSGIHYKIYKPRQGGIGAVREITLVAEKFKIGRRDMFLLVGNKKILNLGGFVAAIFRRGSYYIKIPYNCNKKDLTNFYLQPSLREKYISIYHPPLAIFFDKTLNPKCPAIIPLANLKKNNVLNNFRWQIKAINIQKDKKIITLIKKKSTRYKVYITPHLFNPVNKTLEFYLQDISDDRKRMALVVIDNSVRKLYGKKVKKYLKSKNITFHLINFAGGEKHKNLKTIINILKHTKRFGLGNKDLFVGIGGGITLDICGFAAAIYKGGVDYIRIPTTLLGMIDAGIGIKVGCNFEKYKNYIGRFYDRHLVVLNDPLFLRSLSRNDISFGIAEIVKMGIVVDAGTFQLLEKHQKILINGRFQNNKYATKVLNFAIYWMIKELHKNLYERKTLKRLVDFGHTFSPYLEVASHYRIAHGEAVAIDIAICAELAYIKRLCSVGTRNRIINLLLTIGLPIYHPLCKVQNLYPVVEDIKLHRGGNLNLPLPIAIGHGVFINNFTREELYKALLFLRKKSEVQKIISYKELFTKINNPYEVAKRAGHSEMWLEKEKLPKCKGDELIILMIAAGICRTDLRVYTGERPVPPGRIGHEAFAIIVDAGKKARKRGYHPKMMVVIDCNHPNPAYRDQHLDAVFGRAYKVPSDFVMSSPQQRVISLNKSSLKKLSPASAALLEPMTVALHAVDYLRRGHPAPRKAYNTLLNKKGGYLKSKKNCLRGKNVVVSGAGTIAIFCAIFAKLNGAKNLVIINRGKERLKRAEEIIKPTATFLDNIRLEENLKNLLDNRGGVDIAIIASYIGAVQKAVRYINSGGTILMVAGIPKNSQLATDEGKIDLYPIRHDDLIKSITIKGKRIKIMGAHGTNEPLFKEVIQCFSQQKFKELGINPLDQVTHIVSLEALPFVFRTVSLEKPLKNIKPGKILVDFRLQGQVVYTLGEYKTLFPKTSKEFLQPKGIHKIQEAASKILTDSSYPKRDIVISSGKANEFANIRLVMDELLEKIDERLKLPIKKNRKGPGLSLKDRLYLEKAFMVAYEAYEQIEEKLRYREDGRKFIYHPLEVARYAVEYLGIKDREVIAALLLHDTMEYTPVSEDYLKTEFSKQAAAITMDSAQNQDIKRMPIDSLRKKFNIPYIIQCLGIESIPLKNRDIKNIAEIAMKQEHYNRLLNYSQNSLSPVLKIIDNIHNYATVRYLPKQKRKSRTTTELALFRDYLKNCKRKYNIPSYILDDIDDCLTRLEKEKSKDQKMLSVRKSELNFACMVAEIKAFYKLYKNLFKKNSPRIEQNDSILLDFANPNSFLLGDNTLLTSFARLIGKYISPKGRMLLSTCYPFLFTGCEKYNIKVITPPILRGEKLLTKKLVNYYKNLIEKQKINKIFLPPPFCIENWQAWKRLSEEYPKLKFICAKAPSYERVYHGLYEKKPNLNIAVGMLLTILKELKIPHKVEEVIPKIMVKKSEIKKAEAIMKSYGWKEKEDFVINLGEVGSKVHKTYPYMEKVVKSILKSIPEAKIAFIDKGSDEALVGKILRKFPSRVIYVAGRDKDYLVAICALSQFFIGADAGPGHVFAATHRKDNLSLTISSPGYNPLQWTPCGGDFIIQYQNEQPKDKYSFNLPPFFIDKKYDHTGALKNLNSKVISIKLKRMIKKALKTK